jgi:hypothetical protein
LQINNSPSSTEERNLNKSSIAVTSCSVRDPVMVVREMIGEQAETACAAEKA